MTFKNRRLVLQWMAAGALAAVSTVALTAPGFAQVPIVLRLSHTIGKNTPRQHGAELFAKRVGELTNGKVKVEVYADGELGSDAKALEGLQTSTIDFSVNSLWTNVVTAGSVFELPFVFRDYGHLKASLEGEPAKIVADAAEGTGIKIIGFWYGSWRDVYGTKEIKSLADFAGVKIRTQQTPAYVELFKQAKAIPTPIAWPETYMALQQGTVDAAETGFSYMYDAKQFEIAKHGTFTHHGAGPQAFVVSQAKWDSWPADVQQAITTAEKEARDFHNKEILEVEAAVIETLRKEGMTFSDFDATELRRIAHESVYPIVVTDEAQKALLAAVQKL